VADDVDLFSHLQPRSKPTSPASGSSPDDADLFGHLQPKRKAPSPDSVDLFAHLNRRHAVASKGAVEIAVGPDGKPRAPNLLRTAVEAMEVPMSGALAWLRHDDPGDFSWAGDVPRATKLLRTQGMEALNREYGAGSPGELAYGVAHGDPISVARASHPWLNAGMTFGEEMFNPSNLVGGKVVGLGGRILSRGVAAARAASPVVDDAATAWEGAASDVARPFARVVDASRHAAARAAAAAVGTARRVPGVAPVVQGTRHFFDRYAGLRDRGGMPYVGAGHAVQAAPARAEVEVRNDTRSRWGGLTRAQKLELQKLSYQAPAADLRRLYDDVYLPRANPNAVAARGDVSQMDSADVASARTLADSHFGAPATFEEFAQQMPERRLYVRDPAVPEPRSGPSLAERARAVRDDFLRDDVEQDMLGIRKHDEGQLYAGGLYFPMQRLGRRIYADDATEELAAGNPEMALQRAARGRSRYSVGVAKTGHKRYATILDIDDSQLHPEYDPAHQYMQHRLETRRAIYNEYARRELEGVQGVDARGVGNTFTRAGAALPQFARIPVNYVAQRPGLEPLQLGAGEEGREAATRYTDQTTGLLARALARRDPDIVAAAEARGVSPTVLGTRKIVARDPAPYAARAVQARKAVEGTARAADRAQRAASKLTEQQRLQVARIAAGLDRAQRSLLLGDDALGAALRENRTIREALQSESAQQKAAARSVLEELQELRGGTVAPPSSAVVRGAAAEMHAGEMEAQRPFWDALRQVGGKIKPDLVWDRAKKRWTLAGEFANIPRRMMTPIRDLRIPPSGERAPGNIDEIAAIVRNTHPEITEDEVRAFFEGHSRAPRVADFVDQARERVMREVLPRFANAGPEQIGALQRELRAALSRADVARGAAEGAAQASTPITGAASNMRSATELARERIGAAGEALRGTTMQVDASRVTAPLRTLKAKQAAEYDRVRQQLEKARSDQDMQRLWRQTFARHAAEVRPEVAKRIEARAPAGYVRESDLGFGSPSQREMALDESFADFIKAGNGDAATLNDPNARAFWRAMGTLNSIARAGIVLFPLPHATNLSMAYLAGDATGAIRGDVPTMLRIMSGHYKPDPEVYRRAVESGAVAPFSVGAFAGVRDAHALTTNAGELAEEAGEKAGPFSRLVRPFARAGIEADRRLYEPMNRWLFGTIEQGFATDLFERFMRAGFSDGEAAAKIRAMLGDYGNVSAGMRRAHLDKLFYFLPWMRTVIPYWVQKGVIDPKWWSAPVRAIQVNNEQQGFDDPSKPFTMTTGRNADGTVRRMVAPIPQRVLGNVADAATAVGDAARGNWRAAVDAAYGPTSYLTGHLAALPAVGYDALEAVIGRGHAPPWNTFATATGESPAQQDLDVGEKLAGRFVAPFAASERATAGGPWQDAVSYGLGGFAYDTKTKERKDIEHAVRAQYAGLIHDAQEVGNNKLVQQLINEREQRVRNEIARRYDLAPPAKNPDNVDLFAHLKPRAATSSSPDDVDMFAHLQPRATPAP
jgi:hypothetical protein